MEVRFFHLLRAINTQARVNYLRNTMHSRLQVLHNGLCDSDIMRPYDLKEETT
jgi:hypothetical protein